MRANRPGQNISIMRGCTLSLPAFAAAAGLPLLPGVLAPALVLAAAVAWAPVGSMTWLTTFGTNVQVVSVNTAGIAIASVRTRAVLEAAADALVLTRPSYGTRMINNNTVSQG